MTGEHKLAMEALKASMWPEDSSAQKITYTPMQHPLADVLTRIADALDRAYPISKKADGHLKVGVASYRYEDPQTEALRKLQEKAAGGPEEQG